MFKAGTSRNSRVAIVCLISIYLALLPHVSYAAGEAGMLDTITNQYLAAATGWAGQIKNAATYLFITLATISLVWTGIQLVFKKADLAEFFSEFIRFILFFGFFLWLLLNGEVMAQSIVDSFMQLGSQAGNGTKLSTTPSSILTLGWKAYQKVYDATSMWEPANSAIMMLVGAVILCIIALIAVNMTILLICAWFVIYAGVFLLGFGGSRWTSDIAINYFKNVLSIGIQLLAMILLVSIGKQFLDDMVTKYTTGEMNMDAVGNLLVSSLILFALTSKIPGMLGNIASGGSIGNAANGGAALGAAVAGMAMAATGMAMAARELTAAVGAAIAGNAMGGKATLAAAMAKAESALGIQGGDNEASTPDISNMGAGSESSSGTGSISQAGSSSGGGQDGASGQDETADIGRAGDNGQDGTSGRDGETEIKTDQRPQSQAAGNTSDSADNENADSFTTPDITGQQESTSSGGNSPTGQPITGEDHIPPTRLNKGAYAAGAMVGAIADIARTSVTDKMTQMRDSSALGRFAKHIEGDKTGGDSFQSKGGKTLVNRAAEIAAYVNKAHKSTDW